MRSTANSDVFRVEVKAIDQMTGDESIHYLGPYATKSAAKTQASRKKSNDDYWTDYYMNHDYKDKSYKYEYTVQKSLDWESVTD